jgi:hypothetical protein
MTSRNEDLDLAEAVDAATKAFTRRVRQAPGLSLGWSEGSYEYLVGRMLEIGGKSLLDAYDAAAGQLRQDLVVPPDEEWEGPPPEMLADAADELTYEVLVSALRPLVERNQRRD